MVYLYILGEATSAPLNEYTTDEAYDYLETSAESGEFGLLHSSSAVLTLALFSQGRDFSTLNGSFFTVGTSVLR